MTDVASERFRAVATVVLGGIIGACIALPVTLTVDPMTGRPLSAAFTLLGVAAGYKNRAHVGFFYFSLVCATILLAIVWYTVRPTP